MASDRIAEPFGTPFDGSSGSPRPLDRLRAYGYFVIAIAYFWFARTVAQAAARGLNSGGSEQWFLLIDNLCLLFLLVMGYAGMGYAFQHQKQPIATMGLVRRPGWGREVALGVAVGWGLMVACVLPMALFGGLSVTVDHSPRAFGYVVLDFLVLAVTALAEEVVFRGYPFQRAVEAIGKAAATLLVAGLFALIHFWNPSVSAFSLLVTFLSGILFSVAYLRTRALWMGWGIHFSWNVTMGVVFGLPISGITSLSPLISSDALGPDWLSGGYYGPEAARISLLAMIAGIVIVYRVTRHYNYLYNAPVIVPGGIPVDIDAAARRQHEAAMGPAQAAPQNAGLIQILPNTPTGPFRPSVSPSSTPSPAAPEENATEQTPPPSIQ